MVFGNKTAKRIFQPKRKQATESWRRPHDKDLHTLYPASCYYCVQIKGNDMAGHVTCVAGNRIIFLSEIVNDLVLLVDDVGVG